MKLAALCETHYVGLVPHFTGPLAEASLVHCIAASSGPALMEMTGDGSATNPHLPEVYDFRKGKMWPNERPGLGVTFDPAQADLVAAWRRPPGWRPTCPSRPNRYCGI
jgi:galactonate dehydratase